MRVIEGQNTKIARTMHGIGIDSLHDEYVIPNPFADALLVFRGATNEDEAPLRVIHGPKTKLTYPDSVTVDPIHNEILAASYITGAVLVYPREANGDVAPIRIIHGPKTKMTRPWRVVVDPINNLLVVANIKPGRILIFNRTAEGDVAPMRIIEGPKTGFETPGAITLYPKKKLIFVVDGRIGHYVVKGGRDIGTPNRGFVGVWSMDDNGDVPPKAIIEGPNTQLIRPIGVAINPRDGEVFVTDMVANSLFTFSLPELF